MQSSPVIQETSALTGLGETRFPLRVVIASADRTAEQRAIRLVARLTSGLGDDLEFQPLAWSFHLLNDPDWRELAVGDAARADMLVVTSTSPAKLPPAVESWVQTSIGRLRGREAAFVALLGPDECPAGIGSPALAEIQVAAVMAGLAFFAPDPWRDVDEAFQEIHRRAETVTPLLHGILNRSQPGPRWAQNPAQP
jgi:hypothetical protein